MEYAYKSQPRVVFMEERFQKRITDLEDELRHLKGKEQELLRTKSMLSDAQRIAGIGTWEWDIQQGTLTWSPEIYTIVGMDPDTSEITFEDFERMLHPDDQERVHEAMENSLHERIPYNVEQRLILPDKSIKYILACGEMFYDEANQPARMIGTAQDITARKLFEQELRVSEERLALALEATSDGLWDWNISTGEVYFSPRFYTMLDYNPNEFPPSYGMWALLVHPDDRTVFERKMREHIQNKSTAIEQEFRIRTKSGEYRWILSRGKVVEWDQHKPIRMIGTNTDITERKQFEEKLKLTLDELKRSNTELEQFGYIISHDLQEPLLVISSFTQMLKRDYGDQLDDQGLDYLSRVIDGSDTMYQLIKDLLAFARISTRPREPVAVDCNNVFTTATSNLFMSIQEHEARVTSDPLPMVMADETQLVQLFQNLIGNAIKFRGSQPPRVHISVGRMGDKWLFSVQDNGIGIESKYQDKIFDIFHRLHPKDKYPGSGIGLAVCKKIVQRYGGTISLESAPGEGTTFYFSLPICKD